MATVQRLCDQGTRRGKRALSIVAEEFRDKRIALGLSQRQVAAAIHISRSSYTRIESAKMQNLPILLAAQTAAVLGLDIAVRTYPGPDPLRDAAQATRLSRVLVCVGPPLSYRTEVALPQRAGQVPEQRAWDAMIIGDGQRTGVEMEMRIRDAQAMERRIELKRRDDRVDNLLVLVADTHVNRRVLRENPGLFPGLARLTLGAIARMLRDGRHPPSALVLV